MGSNLIFFLLFLLEIKFSRQQQPKTRWENSEANKWQNSVGWLVGPNYVPRTAENTLEMWQEHYDNITINQELKWLKKVTGMNTVRVFLHYIPWMQNSSIFLNRIEEFLQIAQSHNVRTMLVLFDDCWNPNPTPGPQLPPIPHVHNSRWVQCPGISLLNASDSNQRSTLQNYVQGIIAHFANDSRVVAWDLYNEPGNMNKGSYNETTAKLPLSLRLLKKVFTWARQVSPLQPLTSPLWRNLKSEDSFSQIERFQLKNSDIITYHNYGNLQNHQKVYKIIKSQNSNRPHLCTEYMARPTGSTFESILPFLKRENVAAYNWGWVNGKTQTIYPWDSWWKSYTGPPDPWFHDVMYKNGTPYREAEVELIRKMLVSSGAVKVVHVFQNCVWLILLYMFVLL